MLQQWGRLCLYGAIGVTVLSILFPPFSVNGGPDEYGFILAAPPSARQAIAAMAAMGGQQGRAMAADMVHYTVDFVRLAAQVVVVWGVYFALKQTVLKAAAA